MSTATLALKSDMRHALDAGLFAREALGIPLDSWQTSVLTSPAKRTLLNVHRQGGKSTIAAVKAVHRALFVPRSMILMVSPSLRQSGELYRTWRDLLARLDQPPALTQDTTTSATLANQSRVISLPSSESTVRGFAAVDLLLADEAARVEDALYFALRPMLSISDGAIIAMSTPWGRRGWFSGAWHSAEPWQRIEIPATACPRISSAFLDEERRAMGDYWYRQEYLCQFLDSQTATFTSDDIDSAFVEVSTWTL